MPGKDWNARYRDADVGAGRPARVLLENAHLLPPSGRALDLACGLGANALWLAARGLETLAWDRSENAIEKLARYASQQNLSLKAEWRDVERAPPEPDGFDVIAVTHYLERDLTRPLLNALRPGGLLYYQTFTREAVDATGPRTPAYRLAPGELRALFAPLRLLVYREEGRVGDLTQGFRNEALLVGMKR